MSDKKLMNAIEQGKFDLEDYRLEVRRLLKMAKIKNTYDRYESNGDEMVIYQKPALLLK